MPSNQFSSPSPSLEPFIRFYVQRELRIQGRCVVHPVPARACPMIVFDFDDPTDVYVYAQKTIRRSPLVVIVGPQTYRRLELRLQGALDTFVIALQPDGLYRLFSLPIDSMTNLDFDGHSVIGSFISALAERLGNARSFRERVQLVEEAVLPRAL